MSTQVWLSKNDDLTLRRQLTSSVSKIFASTKSVLAGYCQFQINNRASMGNLYPGFQKKKCFDTITLNHV